MAVSTAVRKSASSAATSRPRPLVVLLALGALVAGLVTGALSASATQARVAGHLGFPAAPPASVRPVAAAATAPARAMVAVTRDSSALAAVAVPAVSGSPSSRAWQWVLGQRGPGTPVTSAATITSSRTYPADWTGAVTGTFALRGVSAEVVDPASIAIDSPSPVAADPTGVLVGHVTVPPAPNRWIVQAYRDTSDGRVQVPLQALVDPQGAFRIDLGAVPDPPAGTWALGLLDATAAYRSTGVTWPAAAMLSGLAVRAYVVTDTAYLVGEQPARADGTFAFADSRPGTKVFQLVDTASGAVLAEQAPDFGLVRSYAGGTRTYTYDQALAVLTAVALGDDAAALTDGLISLQRPDGGFVDSADVRNPAAGVPLVRTGVTAIATYALLRRVQTMDPVGGRRAGVVAAARAGVQWLLDQRRPDGLLGAGTGVVDPDGPVDATGSPAWVSTEHNLDAWQTLHLAVNVIGTPPAPARTLADAIVQRLWDGAAHRFRQGLDAESRPDTTDPLDVSSWGTLFLRATGHSDLADEALAHLAAFGSDAGGYRAYYPQPAFPNAPANLWVEGTAGVALAHLQAGQQAAGDADLATLAGLQRADGGLPYATVADAATGMTSAESVAAAAWFVLASQAPHGATIWD